MATINRFVKAIQRRVKRLLHGYNKPPKIDPSCPFGDSPRADRETYLKLYQEACAREYPEIQKYLENFDFSVDVGWLEDLALHTQVVIKHSALNFQHGYILYSLVRDFVEKAKEKENIFILETGTARGFSAVCMARALLDAHGSGTVLTIDIIPHHNSIYWNCIDDGEGKKTRELLLQPWQKELERIIFLEGESQTTLGSLSLPRVHFAFLDACHTEEEVIFEFNYVAERQQVGDIIFLDDVTEGVFDGVVNAVRKIEKRGDYSVDYLLSEENRGYAIATRTRIDR